MAILQSLKSLFSGTRPEGHAYLDAAADLYTDDLNTQPQGGGRIPAKEIAQPSTFDIEGYRKLCAESTNEPVRRAVIYPTMMCNERCKFCYYLDMIDNPRKPVSDDLPLGGARHRDFDRVKLELEIYRRYYDLTHVDITGGEPTIFPKIVDLVAYAREIGIMPCIISNGQRPQAWEELIDNGLHDALLSIHGFEEEQDRITQKPGSWKRLMKTIGEFHRLDFTFRTNSVVGIWDYQYLPALAETIATEIRPRIHNFIVFNPHEGNQWGRDYDGERRTFEEQAGYSAIAPYVKQAIDVLCAHGIWPNVRYMPLCQMEGYEQHVCNFQQWQHDPHEWFYHQYTHKQLAELTAKAKAEGRFGTGIDAALSLIAARETQGNVYAKSCEDCSYRKICDGVYPQYESHFGLDELKAVQHPAGPITDPMHFRKPYVGYRIPKESWHGPSPEVVAKHAPSGRIWASDE
jgi:MoaA/NifB/PqqE/SkfB family radical SAM enzyme